MRTNAAAVLILGSLAAGTNARADFRTQEIAKDLGVVYAVNVADMNKDGKTDIVARVAQYKRDAGGHWQRSMIDDGMATEDLVTADLDGDGRAEVVAGGRATSNIRIYWRK